MRNDDKDMADEAVATPVKKRKGRWVVLLLVVLVLGTGGGAAGYWWMHRADAAAHAAADVDKLAPPGSGVMPLEQFTVNLADKEAPRFLRATVHLVLDHGDEVEALKEDALKVMRVRSAVLELLTVQTSDRVVTPEGKAELKHAIATRSSAILKPVKVLDVLFSDFVVQF